MPGKVFLRGKRFLTRPFTFLILPPCGARTRTIRLPCWLMACAGLFLIGIAAISISGLIDGYRARSERAELRRLRLVNERQQRELVTVREEAEEARAYLEEVKDLDERVRRMTGLLERRGDYGSRSGGRDSARKLRLSLSGAAAAEDPGELVRDLSAVQREAARVRCDLEQLEKDLQEYYKYLAALPDRWPVHGEVTSEFGERSSPFGGRRSEFHDGLDLAANYGAPVAAAGDGVVVFTGYRPGYGHTVVIEHGYGYRSSYCHLSRYLVRPGERVKKGQRIARVGNSGRSTGPHLHFMVEKDGVLIDPLQVLKK